MELIFSEEELLEQLPTAAVEILKVLGLRETIRLVESLGGLDMAVPVGAQDCRNKALFEEVLGSAAAEAFMEIYGGAKLYIPKCEQALRALRNRQFCAEVAQQTARGISRKTAIQNGCLRLHLSERTGYAILEAEKNKQSPDRQKALF